MIASTRERFSGLAIDLASGVYSDARRIWRSSRRSVLVVPDTMMGEKVVAVVVLRPGAQAEPQEIVEFLHDKLADYKAPQFMVMRADLLPRNPGGKILKARLLKEVGWGKPVG